MLRINKNIEIFPHAENATLYDKKRQIEYSVGKIEMEVIQFLLENETESLEEILLPIPENYINEIIDALKENNIIENSGNDIKKKNNLSICIFNYDKLKKVKIHLERFAFFIAVFPLICFAIAILNFVLKGNIETFFDCVQEIPQKKLIIFLYLGCYVSLFFHELFHAIFARRFGAHIVEIGIMMKFVFPCLYLRLVGLPLSKKRHRIIIYSGGLYCHLMMVAIAVSMRIIFQKYSVLAALSLMFGIVNVILLCVNSLPVFQLDGHKIYIEIFGFCKIAEWIQILRTSSEKVKKLFVIILLITYGGIILIDLTGIHWLGIVELGICLAVLLFLIPDKIVFAFYVFIFLIFFLNQYILMIGRLIHIGATFFEIVINTVVFLGISNTITLVICVVCYFLIFLKNNKKG